MTWFTSPRLPRRERRRGIAATSTTTTSTEAPPPPYNPTISAPVLIASSNPYVSFTAPPAYSLPPSPSQRAPDTSHENGQEAAALLLPPLSQQQHHNHRHQNQPLASPPPAPGQSSSSRSSGREIQREMVAAAEALANGEVRFVRSRGGNSSRGPNAAPPRANMGRDRGTAEDEREERVVVREGGRLSLLPPAYVAGGRPPRYHDHFLGLEQTHHHQHDEDGGASRRRVGDGREEERNGGGSGDVVRGGAGWI